MRVASKAWAITTGQLATMPAKMISEMPLPTPRAVICSPSHIRNTVPPVSVMTAEIRTTSQDPYTTPQCSSPTAMRVALDRGQQHRAIARILVEDCLRPGLALLFQLLRDAA